MRCTRTVAISTPLNPIDGGQGPLVSRFYSRLHGLLALLACTPPRQREVRNGGSEIGSCSIKNGGPGGPGDRAARGLGASWPQWLMGSSPERAPPSGIVLAPSRVGRERCAGSPDLRRGLFLCLLSFALSPTATSGSSFLDRRSRSPGCGSRWSPSHGSCIR